MANTIEISGMIASEPELSHVSYGENFYEFYICTPRRSETHDTLPCIVSETLVDEISEGDNVALTGEIRTKKVMAENGRKYLVYIFVRELRTFTGEYYNNVCGDARTFGECEVKKTLSGKDVCSFIAVSRRANGLKEDYIPCLAWGRSALRLSSMVPGTSLKISGRFQSKKHTKTLEDGTAKPYETYALSLNWVEEL